MNPAFMRAAIKEARKGIREGQAPFGCCIVRNGKMVVCAHNEVFHNPRRRRMDITAHAEIVAIRAAYSKLKATFFLDDCELYSTCEPCPMCFSAIHWARIKTIYFGAEIADAQKAGFNELAISNEVLKKLGKNTVKIVRNVLKPECQRLFEEWKKNPKHKRY